MSLQPHHLLTLTLNDKVYHPIFREGKIVEIKDDSLLVRFKTSVREFKTTGSFAITPLISELYLKPVKIVYDNE